MYLNGDLVGELQQFLRRVTDCWDPPSGEERRELLKLARRLNEAIQRDAHACAGLGIVGLMAPCPKCYPKCDTCGADKARTLDGTRWIYSCGCVQKPDREE